MSKMLWNALVLSPAVLGATIIAANSTLAADNSRRSITQENATAINLPAIGSFQERPEAQATNTAIQGLAVSPSSEVSSIPTKPTQVAQVPDAVNEPSTDSTLDRINQYNEEVDSSTEVESLDQVTSVSQLRDVQPTDWAFQALQSLVERYGCIEGYPDRTYRGNRAMTRYEFAAGLNKCLDRIQELIAALPQGVSKEDLGRLQRLQEEFAAEIATLRGRVDALEARVNTVESQQFSTTTKLSGEVIFAPTSVFGDERAIFPSPYDPAVPGTAGVEDRRARGGLQDNAFFAYRARLNFDTSFTGKDLLRARVQARNITQLTGNVTGTSMTRLAFDGVDPIPNGQYLSKLFYRFPIGSSVVAVIDAIGGEFNENVYAFNPLFESSSGGSISRFGRFNPIYRQGEGGSGVTLNFNPQGTIGLAVGYLANFAYDPDENRGLNGGNFGALAQLSFRPSKDFGLGLTYARSYNPADSQVVNVSGNTGSEFSNFPFGRNVGTSANHYGAELTWRPAKNLVLSGWAGWTQAFAQGNDQRAFGGFSTTAASGARRGDEANLLNWAVTLALPDLGRKGNVLGFVFGMPPKVIDSDLNRYQLVNGAVVQSNREDEDTSYHIEGLYKIQVSNNISITPGVLVILNPEHWDKNDTIWVGTVRTTFRF